MPAVFDNGECIACGACVDVCPVSIIEVDETAVLTDESACTECGSCVDECPSDAIKL